MIKLRRHGIRWEMAPDCRPLLDKLLADTGSTVKQTPTKLVTAHRIDGRSFYLKRYLNGAKPLRRLKYLVKSSKAKQEWQLAQRFEALAIPLVRHLAFGERWTASGLQESLLVTEAFDGVELSKSSVHQTAEVQVALAGFLRHMHDQGVLQRDLHHNILVRIDPVELRRVDLGNARIQDTVTEPERMENLAWFNVNVTLADAFFEVYGANSEFVREARQRSLILRRESREKNSWRCLRHGLFFAPMRRGRRNWWVRREFSADQLRPVLDDPERPTEQFLVQRFKTESAARHAFRTSYHLELLGIPTPRPVAAGKRDVLTEAIAGAVSLARLPADEIRSDEALLEQIVTQLARLHDEGFAGSGKLAARHFLVASDGAVLILPGNELRYLRQVSLQAGENETRAVIEAIAKPPAAKLGNTEPYLQVYRRSRVVVSPS